MLVLSLTPRRPISEEQTSHKIHEKKSAFTLYASENPMVCLQDGFHVMNGQQAINLTTEENRICKTNWREDPENVCPKVSQPERSTLPNRDCISVAIQAIARPVLPPCCNRKPVTTTPVPTTTTSTARATTEESSTAEDEDEDGEKEEQGASKEDEEEEGMSTCAD